MNLKTRLAIATLGLLALVLGWSIVAQEPVPRGPYEEEIAVRVLNIEAVVTDRDGVRVPNLDPSQFRLLVDGEEVPIEFFNEVRNGVTIPSGDNVPDLTPGEPAGVSYLLFIDEFFSIKRDKDRVLQSLVDRVDSLEPQDRVAVVAWDGANLTMLSGWTHSKDEITAVLNTAIERPAQGLQREQERRRFSIRSPLDSTFSSAASASSRSSAWGGSDPRWDLGTQERQYASLLVSQLNATVGSADAAMRALDVPGGRMAHLVLSGGWPWDVSTFVAGSSRRMVSDARVPNGAAIYGPLGTTANLLGYTLYTVDLPGMQTGRGGAGASTAGGSRAAAGDAFFLEAEMHNSLSFLADKTGGFALLNGMRLNAFDEVGADLNNYYWLGFSPSWQGSDETHAIEVEISDPNLRARTRTTFTDLSKASQIQMAVRSSLLFGTGATDDAIRVEFGEAERAGRRRVDRPVTINISMGALESQRTDDGYTTQVVVFVAALDDDGGTSDITPTPLTFASKGRPKDKDWATFETTLHMRRRTNQIAVAVYDVVGDNVLARTVDIE